MTYKKYLHFITEEGNRDHVESLTSNWDFFDGIFAVVHKGKKEDGTQKLIEERKKDGCVQTLDCYYRKHDLAMNMNLQHPTIQHGDWIFLLDTMERINKDFYPEIDPLIEFFIEQGGKTFAFEGKTFMFERDVFDQFFIGTPHWRLFNSHEVPQIELSLLNNKFKNARINLRPQYRPIDHEIDHFVKYLWEFADSNQGVMDCNSDKDDYINFETDRRLARIYATKNNIPTDTIEFGNWLIDNKESYPEPINKLFANKNAKSFRNFYRLHVLKEDFHDIKRTENEWTWQ